VAHLIRKIKSAFFLFDNSLRAMKGRRKDERDGNKKLKIEIPETPLLLQLPLETWDIICSLLPESALANLLLTSKALYDFLHAHLPACWKKKEFAERTAQDIARVLALPRFAQLASLSFKKCTFFSNFVLLSFFAHEKPLEGSNFVCILKEIEGRPFPLEELKFNSKTSRLMCFSRFPSY
jgi:hypothetical protein